MQELRRSQQPDQGIEWQSPKVVFPRLPAKKAGSLPSYSNLKTGGGDYSRAKGESTFSEDNQLEIIRTVDCPKVSARAWLVYNREADVVIKSVAARSRREIASLTKLMSALCTLQLCEHFNMQPKETYFRVTQTAVDVSGTIANLQAFEWINIHDLLYGLMLPSGNDAANLLAENLGAILYFEAKGEVELLKEIKSIDLTEDEEHVEIYIQHFLDYMNAMARRMNLRNTKFTNPHGLDYRSNYSCCEDILRLSLLCFQNQVFPALKQFLQRVCSTKQHKAEVRIYRNKTMYRKGITWQNTNKLLGSGGCRGMKTGYTPKAGGCLSSIFESTLSTGNTATIVVVVLGSKTQQHRFFDTSRLVEYASEELRYLLK